ncbi:MAG: hypothetical protein GXO70_01075 [Acidobacteria bacterium]|nr:hypothetical protein [Acidobacteriota bacterium]
MNLVIQLATDIILVGAALGAIGLAVRLQQRTREPLAAIYLFYLVFSLFYGFFALMAPELAESMLPLTQGQSNATSAVHLLFPFLSVPLLISVLFLFFAMVLSLINRRPSPAFSILFVLLAGLLFACNGISLYRNTHPGFPIPLVPNTWFIFSYNFLRAVVVISALITVLVQSRHLREIHRKKLARKTALILLTLELVRVPLSFFHSAPVLLVAFQVSWFVGDLWPLLYLDRALPRIRRRERSTTDDLIERGGVTPREHEIVQLICQGKSNNEIADVLFISVQTVKTHTYRIYRKLGVRNRVQLTNLFLGDKIGEG